MAAGKDGRITGQRAMTIPEIRAALAAYRNDGRMFSPREWAGMVEALLADIEGLRQVGLILHHFAIDQARKP